MDEMDEVGGRARVLAEGDVGAEACNASAKFSEVCPAQIAGFAQHKARHAQGLPET